MTIVNRQPTKGRGRLHPVQEGFFLVGFHLLDRRDFPFNSQRQRRKLWEKHRGYLMAAMYWDEERFELGMAPYANSLRPREWWVSEGPERLVFNGARIISTDIHTVWDKQPAQETEMECLERLGLLTDKDIQKIDTEAFQRAESASIRYREYLVNLPASPGVGKEMPSLLPFPLFPKGEGCPHTSEGDGLPFDCIIATDEEPPLDGGAKEAIPNPEGPPPEEIGGQCPRCQRKLRGLDGERLACPNCGGVYDRLKLGTLWRNADYARRRKGSVGEY